MSDQKKILHDDRNRLDYVLVGDYFIPNLTLSEEEEQRAVDVWGQRHLSCF